jgi:hypothetical protein
MILCCAGTGSDHLYYWSCDCFQQVRCSEWSNDAHQVGSGNHGACVGPSAAFCHQTQEVHTISTQLQLLLLTYLYIYRIIKLLAADPIHARSTLQYKLFGICQDYLRKWEFPNVFGWLREFQELKVFFLWEGNLSKHFESLFLGEGICPRILKVTLWGRELVQGLWKVFFLEMNLCEDFESFSNWEGNLSNDIKAFSVGKEIVSKHWKLFWGRGSSSLGSDSPSVELSTLGSIQFVGWYRTQLWA